MNSDELEQVREETEALSRLALTPWFDRRCPQCNETFGTTAPDNNTMWTQWCPECLETIA